MIDKPWPYGEDDYMELGDSGIIPIKDGWFYNKNTKESVDPNGVVYNQYGEIVYDPLLEEDEYEYPYGDDEYEWYPYDKKE